MLNNYLVNYTVFTTGLPNTIKGFLDEINAENEREPSPSPDDSFIITNDTSDEDEEKKGYHDPSTLLVGFNGKPINYEEICLNKNKLYMDRKVLISALSDLHFTLEGSKYICPKIDKETATQGDIKLAQQNFKYAGAIFNNYIRADNLYAIPVEDMNKLMTSINTKLQGSSGKLGILSEISLRKNYIDETLMKQCETLNANSNNESETAGFFNPIFCKIFKTKFGYIVGPENKSGTGRVDGFIK
jgi:hypothetical protein